MGTIIITCFAIVGATIITVVSTFRYQPTEQRGYQPTEAKPNNSNNITVQNDGNVAQDK